RRRQRPGQPPPAALGGAAGAAGAEAGAVSCTAGEEGSAGGQEFLYLSVTEQQIRGFPRPCLHSEGQRERTQEHGGAPLCGGGSLRRRLGGRMPLSAGGPV